MSLKINGQVINPEVINCICGGETEHTAILTSWGTGGHAYVKCLKCGLEMIEQSYKIGYEDTLESIYLKVASRWNSTMKKN